MNIDLMFYFVVFLVAAVTIVMCIPCATDIPSRMKMGKEGATSLMISAAIICVVVGVLDQLVVPINFILANMAMFTEHMFPVFLLAAVVYFMCERRCNIPMRC